MKKNNLLSKFKNVKIAKGQLKKVYGGYVGDGTSGPGGADKPLTTERRPKKD